MNVVLLEELIQIIIEHTRHDRMTLESCSLVNSTWSAIARKHIFARIVLHNIAAAKRLGQLFLLFPSRAHLVREVQLHPTDDDPMEMHKAIGRPLPGLETLELHTNVTLTMAGHQDTTPDFSHFATARTLNVLFTEFNDLAQLQAVLSQLKHLDRLLFSVRTEWTGTSRDPSFQAPCDLYVRQLDLRGLFHYGSMNEFCTWMGQGKPGIISGVEMLRCNSNVMSHVDLERCASSLKELHIRHTNMIWNGLGRSLPLFPSLTMLTMNAFNRHASGHRIEELIGHFCAVAPQLHIIRVDTEVIRIPGAPTTGVLWSKLLEFITSTEVHPTKLDLVEVSLPKSSKKTATWEEYFDLAEREAKLSPHLFSKATIGRVAIALRMFDRMGEERRRYLYNPSFAGTRSIAWTCGTAGSNGDMP